MFLIIEPIALGFVQCDMKSLDRFDCMKKFLFIKTSLPYEIHQPFGIFGIMFALLLISNAFGLMSTLIFVGLSASFELQ